MIRGCLLNVQTRTNCDTILPSECGSLPNCLELDLCLSVIYYWEQN